MAAGPNDLVTLGTAYGWLGLTSGSDDTNLQLAITAYSKLIATWCSRNFVSASYSEVYDGKNNARLTLRNYPVTAVASLTVNDQPKTLATNYYGPGYKFEDRFIDLLGGDRFWSGLENVAVTYTAGYASNEIPSDLQMACLEWLKTGYLSRQREPGLVSEQAGDHKQQFMPGGAVTDLGSMVAPMPPSVFAILSQYKNVVPA